MEFLRIKNNLIQALIEMKVYHGASAKFARVLERKLGVNIHRKISNDILDGKIKFVRDKWEMYLPIIHKTAIDIVEEYKEKQSNNSVRNDNVNYNRVFDYNRGMSYIEEVIQLSDTLELKGDMSNSMKNIEQLSNFIIDIDYIKEKNLYLYKLYHFVYAKLQLQYGISKGSMGSINLARKGKFELDAEPNMAIKSLNLQGVIFRQIKKYDLALHTFQNLIKLINAAQVSKKDKEFYLNEVKHQIAITLFYQSKISNDESIIYESKELFRQTNNYFLSSNYEIKYEHNKMREAELLVHSGDMKSSESILSRYEDYRKIALMNKAQQAIFFRINAEKYLKIGDVVNAIEEYKVAIKISLDENYKHQLVLLDELYNNNETLRTKLPDDFSVYAPIWS